MCLILLAPREVVHDSIARVQQQKQMKKLQSIVLANSQLDTDIFNSKPAVSKLQDESFGQSKGSDSDNRGSWCFRQLKELRQLQPHKAFENLIIFLIFTSSVLLAIDNPLNDPKGDFMVMVEVIDNIHTVLFTVEACIKIIGLGMAFNDLGQTSSELKPYLKSSANCLDLFVVLISIASMIQQLTPITNASTLKSLKSLRALRGLRPLRMISRNEGMRLVLNALIASIPSMTNVLLVCLLLLLIFAIMGVNFFKGAFFSCHGLPPEKIELVDTK